MVQRAKGFEQKEVFGFFQEGVCVLLSGLGREFDSGGS